MPKTLKEDIFETWIIDGSDATWTLAPQARIDVDNMPAIDILATSTGNRFNINGQISATNDFGTGIDVDGADTRIVVGKNAIIEATIGISGSAADLRITNKGEIEGNDYGVQSDEAMKLRNNGDISGLTGVLVNEGSRIVNGKDGVIEGESFGIDMGAGTVINHGTISGGSWAIMMGSGEENRVVNTGVIDGQISFGGDMIFLDTRKGEITGRVFGGDNGDVYKIGKHGIDLVEEADGGHDKVYSTHTHMLADNVESLYLTGKRDASGMGNDDENFIRGNKGDNTLAGNAGDDYIGGGAGDDILNGGDDDDFFWFIRGGDKDRVTDFVQGEDKIWMTGFDSLGNFVEVQSRMSQHGEDTWIQMGQGDRLIIENVDKDDLQSSDFSFYEFTV